MTPNTNKQLRADHKMSNAIDDELEELYEIGWRDGKHGQGEHTPKLSANEVKHQLYEAVVTRLPEKLTHHQQESERTKLEKAYWNKAISLTLSNLRELFGVEE